MCGISGAFGKSWTYQQLAAMLVAQRHRGPDDEGMFVDAEGRAGLAHNRLSIIDLSPAGHQPKCSSNGQLVIAFNGEIYNYLELRAELRDYPFDSGTDTEVILAAYQKWGEACLERFVGMFAFLLWDLRERLMLAARDRFGVKPLYYHIASDGTLLAASEIKALHAAGVEPTADTATWATYLTEGLYDHSRRTFWREIETLGAGELMIWKEGSVARRRWYDLAGRIGAKYDTRSDEVVSREYLALLTSSVGLRFRSDVRVGINLSGGVDSSTLFGLVQQLRGPASSVRAFTFVTGDKRYDELPWVEQMLAGTHHELTVCPLTPAEVPDLAESVQHYQDEPFGGIPTLAYARLFEYCRREGVTVLLDGQGMDEQWAGYDYYRWPGNRGQERTAAQGMKDSPVRPNCLVAEFRARREPFEIVRPFSDDLRNLQFRDIFYTKIPRALRFNDRISMRSSTELREPFLDHQLVELALRQPPERKLRKDTTKWMLRELTRHLLPRTVGNASKRPVQTPQREWLRGPLREWATEMIEASLAGIGGAWFNKEAVREAWRMYVAGAGDNSFFVWQWISVALINNLGGGCVKLRQDQLAAAEAMGRFRIVGGSRLSVWASLGGVARAR